MRQLTGVNVGNNCFDIWDAEGPCARCISVKALENECRVSRVVRRDGGGKVRVDAVPVTLPVQEDVPAGSVALGSLVPGRAIKIMTGAPLPEGADTVVKVEDTIPGDRSVEILSGAPLGTAVREAGGASEAV